MCHDGDFSEDVDLEWLQRLLIVAEKPALACSDGEKSSVVDQVCPAYILIIYKFRFSLPLLITQSLRM